MAVPGQLAGAIEAFLEGHGGHRLSSARLSEIYRAGGTSAEIDLAAYLVARLPATYAALAHVLAEIARLSPAFAPLSLLDAGSGPGTASWAAVAQWPALAQVQFVDNNREFLDLALRLAEASDNPALRGAGACCGNLAQVEPGTSADLVIASYALAEVPERSHAAVLRKLWNATSRMLVLIEPGTPSGFARVRGARELLLKAGAHPVAPCPHGHACPVMEPDWCHFSVRLPRCALTCMPRAHAFPSRTRNFRGLLSAARRDPWHPPASWRLRSTTRRACHSNCAHPKGLSFGPLPGATPAFTKRSASSAGARQ